MSSSLSQVLSEARQLVTRLYDRERLADGAVAQSQSLNEKINVMKEYQEDLHELNELNHQKPRSGLVHSLQQENRQIRQLQNDNRELKLTLEEHQNVLELLMQKHRETVLKVMQMSKLQTLAEKAMESSVEATSETMSEALRVYDLARVLNNCLRVGEEASHRDQEELSRLRSENGTLRQLLKIAITNDPSLNIQFKNSGTTTTDKTPTSPPTPLAAESSTPSPVTIKSLPNCKSAKLNGTVVKAKSESPSHSTSGPPTPTASPQRKRFSPEEVIFNNRNNNDINKNGNNKSTAIRSLMNRSNSLQNGPKTEKIGNGITEKTTSNKPTIPDKRKLMENKSKRPPNLVGKSKVNGVGSKAAVKT